MTEGLLYTKVHDLFVPFVKYTEGKAPLFVNLPEALKGYLDEAKAEFPKCEKCNENQPMKPCSFIAYASDFPQFTICVPLKEWFEKYFGDAEK